MKLRQKIDQAKEVKTPQNYGLKLRRCYETKLYTGENPRIVVKRVFSLCAQGKYSFYPRLLSVFTFLGHTSTITLEILLTGTKVVWHKETGGQIYV